MAASVRLKPGRRTSLSCQPQIDQPTDRFWAQRGGVNRVLTLAYRRTYTINEEVRAEEVNHILLEQWSEGGGGNLAGSGSRLPVTSSPTPTDIQAAANTTRAFELELEARNLGRASRA